MYCSLYASSSFNLTSDCFTVIISHFLSCIDYPTFTGSEEEDLTTIVDVAVKAGYSTLVELVQAAGLVDLLTRNVSEGRLTVLGKIV